MANAGCLALAKDNAKATLADCATFRTWVGASGDDAQAQALNRIYKDELPKPADGNTYTLEELQARRPFAIAYTGPGFRLEKDSGDSTWSTGTIAILLEQDIPERITNDPAAIADEFETVIGKIIYEFMALAVGGTGGYLSATSISVPDEWVRSNPDAKADFGDVAMAMLFVEFEGL